MKYVFFIVLLLGVAPVWIGSAQKSEPVTLAPELETRARNLGLELKCPVCQGSAIAESPSEFARSMMVELRSQVQAGKSDAEITQYFVSRYGEDVRLNRTIRSFGFYRDWLCWSEASGLFPTCVAPAKRNRSRSVLHHWSVCVEI